MNDITISCEDWPCTWTKRLSTMTLVLLKDNHIDFRGFLPLSLSEFFIYCISSSWVSWLKWIRTGSRDVEGRIRPVDLRLPICGLERYCCTNPIHDCYCYLIRFDAVDFGEIPTFQRNISAQSLQSKSTMYKTGADAGSTQNNLYGVMLSLLFGLKILAICTSETTGAVTERPYSPKSLLWQTHIQFPCCCCPWIVLGPFHELLLPEAKTGCLVFQIWKPDLDFGQLENRERFPVVLGLLLVVWAISRSQTSDYCK
jgi:hypothetical protein